MGHSDARMTTLYTGEIPLKDVQVAFSRVAYTPSVSHRRLQPLRSARMSAFGKARASAAGCRQYLSIVQMLSGSPSSLGKSRALPEALLPERAPNSRQADRGRLVEDTRSWSSKRLTYTTVISQGMLRLDWRTEFLPTLVG